MKMSGSKFMGQRANSAPQLHSLPRLNSSSENPRDTERIVKAEEHMYIQVRRGHWPDLSPDCKLWTLRDFALQHSNWESFTDRGKLRVIYELGSLLNDSSDKLEEDAVVKARNELQDAVEEVRQLPRVVRADKLRAMAVASLCEGNLNLPSAARRLKEALGASNRREEYDSMHLQNIGRKFKFRGYIEKMEDRAITVGQLRRVIKFCQENCNSWREKTPDMDAAALTTGEVTASPFLKTGQPSTKSISFDALNLYHVDSWLIWPATEGSRCSFVELVAEQAQPAVWCVSHCWMQPHASFVACIEHHQLARGLHRSTGFWIWAYAHRHHGMAQESADPRQSSFCKALDQTSNRLLLVLQDVNSKLAGPFQRSWCMFEVSQSLSRSMSQGTARAPIDIAVCDGDQARLITHGLTEQEEAMENRIPGTGAAAKSEREKAFPVSVVESSLKNSVERSEASVEEDRVHILNAFLGRKAQDMEQMPPGEHENFDRANARLNGFFALTFLRKVSEEHDEESLKDIDLDALKELVGTSFLLDAERTDIDLRLGGGGGPSVNEELFLLVKNLPPRLQRITLDMQGSGLKNASLADLANFLSPELQEITVDLQGSRGVNDNGLKRFMDNFIENAPVRSKLKTVSCLLLGTKVEEGCQEACEILDLEQIRQVRQDLELQERKNYIKRLMKNIVQGKAPVASLRKLLERDTEVKVQGVLGEEGKVDVVHVEWNINSMNMDIMIDQALLKMLLDFNAGFEMRKQPEAAIYSVLWPVASNTQTRYEVSHRHKAFAADKFAEELAKAEPDGHRAIAGKLLEVRAGDFVKVTSPIVSQTLKQSLIYACREGSMDAVTALLRNGGNKLLGEVDAEEWDEEDLERCGLKVAEAPSGNALMGACWYGHHEVMEKLVGWGADIHVKHPLTEATALIMAAQKGWREAVDLLLDEGAEEEARDIDGRTPLSWAAGNGQMSVLNVLIELPQIHIDLADYRGLTPLMHGTINQQVAAVQKLIDCNANVRAICKDDKTAMMYATIYETDKMGVQQKKQKILDALESRIRELNAIAEQEAAEREAAEKAKLAEEELEAV
mmetsp:Transcript_41542/g.74625  ORF Transcript_41542/g.74625 Transcript_41542/m.74625 type:complete len:1073 (-) Transcript_41542:31-3249(-)